MSDIRQEFEAKFKMPEGVKYGSHDGTRTYFAESREHRREADTYRHLWLGYQAAHKAQQAKIERLKERVDEWVDFATSHSAPFRAKSGHLVNRGWVCQVCGQDPTEALEGNQ